MQDHTLVGSVTWSEELLCPCLLWGIPGYWGSVRHFSVPCAVTWLTQSHCGCSGNPLSCTFGLAESVPYQGELSISYSSPLCPCPSSRLSPALAPGSPQAGWISPGRDSTAADLCSLALGSALQLSFHAGGTGFFWYSISTWFPLSVLLKSPSRAAAEASTLRPVAFKLSLLLNQTCLRGTKEKILMKRSWNSIPDHCYLGCKNNMEECHEKLVIR